MQERTPGPIVLLGSGETLPSSGKIHETIARRLPDMPNIVILETPAGFEPNSDDVAGKIKAFLETRLQNYHPKIRVLPARHKDTPFSPDAPEILEPMLTADEILLGPGSPTYAVRQLRESLAFHLMAARHRRGAAVFLSSAAALAFGAVTLPVYEIYKVGEDLHWKNGLDFFGSYGLSLTIIPHWNNQDGGEELDTSRCYMGAARFDKLLELLPTDHIVLGIDEHTSLLIDFEEGCGSVLGMDSISIIKDSAVKTFRSGSRFSLEVLGDWKIPDRLPGVPGDVWETVLTAEEAQAAGMETPAQVRDLVERREAARSDQDWAAADRLREKVLDLGWEIRDTPDGSKVSPRKEE